MKTCVKPGDCPMVTRRVMESIAARLGRAQQIEEVAAQLAARNKYLEALAKAKCI